MELTIENRKVIVNAEARTSWKLNVLSGNFMLSKYSGNGDDIVNILVPPFKSDTPIYGHIELRDASSRVCDICNVAISAYAQNTNITSCDFSSSTNKIELNPNQTKATFSISTWDSYTIEDPNKNIVLSFKPSGNTTEYTVQYQPTLVYPQYIKFIDTCGDEHTITIDYTTTPTFLSVTPQAITLCSSDTTSSGTFNVVAFENGKQCEWSVKNGENIYEYASSDTSFNVDYDAFFSTSKTPTSVTLTVSTIDSSTDVVVNKCIPTEQQEDGEVYCVITQVVVNPFVENTNQTVNGFARQLYTNLSCNNSSISYASKKKPQANHNVDCDLVKNNLTGNSFTYELSSLTCLNEPTPLICPNASSVVFTISSSPINWRVESCSDENIICEKINTSSLSISYVDPNLYNDDEKSPTSVIVLSNKKGAVYTISGHTSGMTTEVPVNKKVHQFYVLDNPSNDGYPRYATYSVNYASACTDTDGSSFLAQVPMVYSAIDGELSPWKFKSLDARAKFKPFIYKEVSSVTITEDRDKITKYFDDEVEYEDYLGSLEGTKTIGTCWSAITIPQDTLFDKPMYLIFTSSLTEAQIDWANDTLAPVYKISNVYSVNYNSQAIYSKEVLEDKIEWNYEVEKGVYLTSSTMNGENKVEINDEEYEVSKVYSINYNSQTIYSKEVLEDKIEWNYEVEKGVYLTSSIIGENDYIRMYGDDSVLSHIVMLSSSTVGISATVEVMQAYTNNQIYSSITVVMPTSETNSNDTGCTFSVSVEPKVCEFYLDEEEKLVTDTELIMFTVKSQYPNTITWNKKTGTEKSLSTSSCTAFYTDSGVNYKFNILLEPADIFMDVYLTSLSINKNKVEVSYEITQEGVPSSCGSIVSSVSATTLGGEASCSSSVAYLCNMYDEVTYAIFPTGNTKPDNVTDMDCNSMNTSIAMTNYLLDECDKEVVVDWYIKREGGYEKIDFNTYSYTCTRDVYNGLANYVWDSVYDFYTDLLNHDLSQNLILYPSAISPSNTIIQFSTANTDSVSSLTLPKLIDNRGKMQFTISYYSIARDDEKYAEEQATYTMTIPFEVMFECDENSYFIYGESSEITYEVNKVNYDISTGTTTSNTFEVDADENPTFIITVNFPIGKIDKKVDVGFIISYDKNGKYNGISSIKDLKIDYAFLIPKDANFWNIIRPESDGGDGADDYRDNNDRWFVRNGVDVDNGNGHNITCGDEHYWSRYKVGEVHDFNLPMNPLVELCIKLELK